VTDCRHSGSLVVMAALGGKGSLSGLLLGAATSMMLEAALSQMPDDWTRIVRPAATVRLHPNSEQL
jgi:ABC-type branched-subunit amino acid transport system permease subunit